ncbi:Oxidoreductase protein [Candidatus Zixiibacteriota bacterium]|nr:Oxidoreductase protein [candidate division Zixibacteria bacterium]
MNKLRTAVIGVGHLGRHHARWYHNIKEAELVGVFDTESSKCRQVADEFGVTAFNSIDDIIGAAEAVSIATPSSNHCEIAEKFISAGIHCLIEKPIAVNIDEADKIVGLAQKSGVIVGVGQIERFNPAVQALRKFDIHPRFIEAHRLAAFDPRGTDVAVILDLMIHDIDLTLHLVKSKPVHIEASAVAVISDTADIANARLTFENGAVANLTASRISLHQMRKLRIFQKSGYYSLDLAVKQADIYRLSDESNKNETGMRVPLGKSGHEILYSKAGAKDEDMLCNELTDFVLAVQNRTRPQVTAKEGRDALKVALEIERIGLNGVR